MSVTTNLSPNPILKVELQKSNTFLRLRTKARIRCSSESNTNDVGDMVALNLSREVAKRKALLAQSREAIEKSREILFRELCLYLSMETQEVRTKWKNMEDGEKWVLVRGFVSDWAHNFHPLSVRSVKQLVDEELLGHQQNGDSKTSQSSSSSSSSSSLFPYLKKLMGLEQ